MSAKKLLDTLFSPIRINQLEVQNRLVMPAMHLGYSPGGVVSERLTRFYQERAQAGTGLIVIGGCSIDEYGSSPEMIGLRDDSFLEGLAKLARVIQSEGTRLFAQLYHAGRYAFSIMLGGKTPLAPSALRSKLTGETPKAMDLADIEMVQESFVRAALRAKSAGLDGVEVLGSAGYLISQFFSPLTNKRDDEYGGSQENRMRFGKEVVEKIRQAVGPEFPIMVRIAGNDFMPRGNTNKEAALFARTLEAAGADAFNVTGGWHETRIPQLPMMVPQAAYTYLALGIRQAVQGPVVACNRINDPLVADRVLKEGLADLIGMARGLLADPLLPQKAMKGEFAAIQHCIGCNHCFDGVFSAESVGCLVNPRCGREMDYTLSPATRPKKVLVIGGGPAGMMAANTAARRGHEVLLYEQRPDLGGQLPVAAKPPGRGEMATLLKDLSSQLEINSVKVHPGQKVTPALIEKLTPDAIIVATGAKPLIPPLAGVEGPQVHTAWEVLSGEVETKSPAVIIGGGAVGLETALFLARRGTITPETLYFLWEQEAETPQTLSELIFKGNQEITVVEMLDKLGQDIGRSTRWSVLQDIQRRGIKTLTSFKVVEIKSDGVVIQKDDQVITLPARSIILAAGAESVSDLYEEIKEKFSETFLIGDARSPRKALEAIQEGFEAGLKI